MDNESGVKHAQTWAGQGCVTAWQEGCWGEKNSGVKDAQAWAVQGWVTSKVGRRG